MVGEFYLLEGVAEVERQCAQLLDGCGDDNFPEGGAFHEGIVIYLLRLLGQPDGSEGGAAGKHVFANDAVGTVVVNPVLVVGGSGVGIPFLLFADVFFEVLPLRLGHVLEVVGDFVLLSALLLDVRPCRGGLS